MLFRILSIPFVCVIAIGIALAMGTGQAKEKRQKAIDFEDEVVEGMNKRPLDSLSTLSEADKRKRKPHLYRKRVGFRQETSETIKEFRYIQ